MLLGQAQCLVAVVLGQLGQQPGDQVLRAFLEHADRAAVRGPLDPAVCRVEGVAGDPGELERFAVDPGAVAVAVRQVDRAVRGDLVQRRGCRDTAGERLHRPAAAGDPAVAGVALDVVADDREVLRQRDRAGQVAPAQLIACENRMHVRVDEARQQRAAGQVDDLGAGADGGPGVRVRLDRDDAPGPDPHGRAGREELVAVEDRAVAEGQVCVTWHRDLPSVVSCPVLKHLTKLLSMPLTNRIGVRLPLNPGGSRALSSGRRLA